MLEHVEITVTLPSPTKKKTVTNIDDIEAYLLEQEAVSSIQYLKAIDIPAKERDVAMRDLRFMGITAGSMFPSIDGVCEELRE